MFSIQGNGVIEITQGTFNNIKFDDLTVEKLQNMTVNGTVYETENGFEIK